MILSFNNKSKAQIILSFIFLDSFYIYNKNNIECIYQALKEISYEKERAKTNSNKKATGNA